jgi:glycine/D-amino acid oxidase-like deaminating enzyme
LTVAQPSSNETSALHTESSEERILPEDWDHFHVLLEQMLHRVPSLGDAVLERLCNGPEAFSPDCKWIVGEAPEVSTDSCQYSVQLNN